MKPDISELSYGFGIVDELINWQGLGLSAAPIFPSLYEEGQTSGGYDVRLDRPGVPLFLQFKLANRMVRGNAWEVREGLLDVPFFRMKVRPSRFSSQHASLLDLEAAGNEVYYVAPIVSTPAEFNTYYFSREVALRSVFVRPSILGTLPDDRGHHLSYQNSAGGYFFSDPRKIDGDFGFKTLAESVDRHLNRMNFSFKEIIPSLSEMMHVIVVRLAAERRGWSDVDFNKVLEVANPLT